MSHRYGRVEQGSWLPRTALGWTDKTVLHADLFSTPCPCTTTTQWRIGDNVFCFVYYVGTVLE